VGAGEYTDNSIGAAGSTGLGELNIMVCGGFLTVEHMRRGMKPADAAMETLKRVLALAPPRLIDAAGKPKFGLQYYAINKKGEFGAASMFPAQYSGCDERGAALYDCAHLFERAS
jgi:N4-(beta-N-acetylglucosaminyl)-L-asparaginase